MDRWQAQYAYWSQFGIPAYEENAVPDAHEISFPYLTYQAVSNSFNGNQVINASVWTRSTSWAQGMGISDTIQRELGDGGTVIHYEDGLMRGSMWFQAANNFAQTMGDPNDSEIKRVVLTFNVQR